MSYTKLLTSFLFLVFAISNLEGQNLQKAEVKILNLHKKSLRNKKVHDAFLLIHSDKHQIHWNYLNGNEVSHDSNSPDYHFFHSASIGKTFVAVLTSMLYEQNLLLFNDPIKKYLDADIVKGLNVINDVDYSDDITIAHLLNHTSGIPDFFEGIEIEGISFQEYLVEHPDRFWMPIETIELAKKYGTSHFKPGKGYNYTDTEYNLLGLIIEHVTGMELHQVLHEFIFDPLKMSHSSLWLRSEPSYASKYSLTPVYFDHIEVSTFESMSCDWAGGGVVSTTKDLLRFMQALHAGELIREETYKKMQDWQKEDKGMYYGFGLMQFRLKELFFTLPDEELTGHSGSIGSFMYYNKKNDIYFIGSFGQSKYQKKHMVFLIKCLQTIKKELSKRS
jgi:D-alanyl-D-alanine carboxypeptidase